MSRPPLFPPKSTAGIVDRSDGDRVVAASRRPDGTYRKELKIRPGYTPDEDVKRYRSQRQAEEDARAGVKGKVPGLVPSAAQVAIAGMSKAQKKNAKRKEKRKEGAEEEEEEEKPTRTAAKEEVPDDWDADGDGEDDPKAVPLAAPAPAAEPTSAPVDEEKRIKALRKKLRQAEQLREREAAGLTPAEQAKVQGIESLEDEIAKLSLHKDEE